MNLFRVKFQYVYLALRSISVIRKHLFIPQSYVKCFISPANLRVGVFGNK